RPAEAHPAGAYPDGAGKAAAGTSAGEAGVSAEAEGEDGAVTSGLLGGRASRGRHPETASAIVDRQAQAAEDIHADIECMAARVPIIVEYRQVGDADHDVLPRKPREAHGSDRPDT